MNPKRDFPDSRTLLLLVLVLTTLAITFNHPLWLLGLLLLCISVMSIWQISLLRLVKRLKRLGGLIGILVIIHSVTYKTGVPLLVLGERVLVTSGGLLGALSVLLRIAVILAAALLLTLRDSQQLVTALVQMKVPHELAYMILLGIRFIPVLGEEFQDALTAIQLRGVDLKKIKAADKLRIYTAILMPVVAGALLKARRIATAMEARAYRAKPARTWLEWPRLSRADWQLIIASVVLGLGCYWFYVRGGIL